MVTYAAPQVRQTGGVGEPPQPPTTVHCDRSSSIYSRGESVRFCIDLGKRHAGTVLTGEIVRDALMEAPPSCAAAACSLCPGLEQWRCTLDKNGRATVTTSNTESACFLQLRASVSASHVLSGTAAVEPRRIVPSMPSPNDFDMFWAHKVAQLAAVPVNLRMTPVHTCRPDIKVFDVQADSCIGNGVSAYLARPSTAPPKTLPAILVLHGAGVRSSELGYPIHFANQRSTEDWAAGGRWEPWPTPIDRWSDLAGANGGAGGIGNKMGALSMNLNAHGLPNRQPAEYYDSLNGHIKAQYDPKIGESNDQCIQNWTDRETVYFQGVFLRVIRAIDVLTAQPEWDGRTLAVLGSSQGGALAIVAAALDSRVSFVATGQPAMCDHTGPLCKPFPRCGGWPHVLAYGKPWAGGPTIESMVHAIHNPSKRVINACRYYDCVNFAARVRVPTQWTVGFNDLACHPSTVCKNLALTLSPL
eukprot:SAG31_NODE_3114_length_4659_cov_2.682745_2_plen_472_part_00